MNTNVKGELQLMVVLLLLILFVIATDFHVPLFHY